MNGRSIRIAELRARCLLISTGPLLEFGLERLVFDLRAVAHCTLELVRELEAERSARIAIQEQGDQCLAILATHAGEACA